MAFDINKFADNINTYGTLQTNKFEVYFIPPASVLSLLNNIKINENSSDITSIPRLFNFRAEQVKVPGVALDLARINTYGYGIGKQFPTNVHFTDNVITFIDDKNNTLFKFFYIWLNSIVDFSGKSSPSGDPTYRTEYKDNYSCNINIAIYNQDSENVTNVVMKNAYPTYINDVNLAWDNRSELYRNTVGFTFSEWYIDLGNTFEFSPSVSDTKRSLPSFSSANGVLLNTITNAFNQLTSQLPQVSQQELNRPGGAIPAVGLQTAPNGAPLAF
jgi:hypothetical protein